MKKLFKIYRPVLVFIAVFFASYIAMSLLYGAYLKYYAGNSNLTDPITNLVAAQSKKLVETFGYKAEMIPETNAPWMKVIVNDKYIASIIEGCNAVSIMILFVAFILAFAQGFKKTLFFMFAGVALIYAVNLVRICILVIALYEYPEQDDFLHGVVFPGIIYSMVFLLWILWVKSNKKPKNA